MKNYQKLLNLNEILLMIIKRTNIMFISEKKFIKILYKSRMSKELNLANPVTMNEKIQWLKINDRNPLYTLLVDKYEVRNFISNVIGNKYLVPLVNVWDKFEDIDIENLPEKFVLKTTHDSGGIIICSDRDSFDKNKAKQKIEKSLKNNYFYLGCEWPYKNIRPKIICEQYISDNTDSDVLTDYKFYCFNGVVDSVMLCIDREKGEPKFYFFSKEWNLMRYNIRGKNVPSNFTIPKPSCIQDMFILAEKLSVGFPFVRIDMYYANNTIYFGEFTFYPSSGCEKNILEEYQIELGDLINLKLAYNSLQN